ncbi:hypothetical protein DY000_02013195 [Brassica cretica]|uniref:POX domain-containing protein n=1 Tax=Brassica cretica TaxID=69181 RepID=A0ABQ7D1Q6_BRACR|nr:hypothetical protein DY000_02013195 [Brassica cretica]
MADTKVQSPETTAVEDNHQRITSSSPTPPPPPSHWMGMRYPSPMMMPHHMMYPPPPYSPYHHHNHMYHHNHHHQSRGNKHQNASNAENKTIWIGDLLHWMDENYLNSCFAPAGEPDLHSCGFGSQTPHSSDYALYPKLDPNDATPPPAPNFSGAATSMPPEFSPYVSPSPTPKNELFSFLSLKIDTIELMGSAFSYKSCQEWRAILTDHIKVLCSIQFSSVTFLDFIRREAKNGLTRHR